MVSEFGLIWADRAVPCEATTFCGDSILRYWRKSDLQKGSIDTFVQETLQRLIHGPQSLYFDDLGCSSGCDTYHDILGYPLPASFMRIGETSCM